MSLLFIAYCIWHKWDLNTQFNWTLPLNLKLLNTFYKFLQFMNKCYCDKKKTSPTLKSSIAPHLLSPWSQVEQPVYAHLSTFHALLASDNQPYSLLIFFSDKSHGVTWMKTVMRFCYKCSKSSNLLIWFTSPLMGHLFTCINQCDVKEKRYIVFSFYYFFILLRSDKCG